jgi:hypothetical protein
VDDRVALLSGICRGLGWIETDHHNFKIAPRNKGQRKERRNHSPQNLVAEIRAGEVGRNQQNRPLVEVRIERGQSTLLIVKVRLERNARIQTLVDTDSVVQS